MTEDIRKFAQGNICTLKMKGKDQDVLVMGSVNHMGKEQVTVAFITQWHGNGRIELTRRTELIKGFDLQFLKIKPAPKVKIDPPKRELKTNETYVLQNGEISIEEKETVNKDADTSQVKTTRRKATTRKVQSDESEGSITENTERDK